jgi:hypothetical protein
MKEINEPTEMPTCSICSEQINGTGISPGYALNDSGEKICYKCCGVQDAVQLSAITGKEEMYLYLSFNKEKKTYEITNWPATLIINPTRIHSGKHNIAGTQTHVWFRFNHEYFHGVNFGNTSQVLVVKKIKK